MLPATLHIVYSLWKGNYPAPTISWYFLCKDQNQENEIVVNESSSASNLENIYKDVFSSITCYRPNIASLCPVSYCTQLLDIFNEMPLHKIIYSWLEEDLKSIGWID